MSVITRVLRGAPLAILVGAAARDVAAQQGAAPKAIAELRIRVTGELAPLAESGMLTFPGQGPNAVLQAVATDADGKPVSEARFAPRWETSDANVVSLYSAPTGPSMRIVAQQDGRATVKVTAGGKTASLPVAVGKGRLEIGAGEVTPAFRVARLELRELQPSGEGKLSGRALLLGENGDQTILGARAWAADGREIPLEHFPVTWASTEATVAELFQTFEAQTRITGRQSGRATVTAAIQGVSVAIEAFVGDKRADADASALSGQAVATSAAAPTTTTAVPTVTAMTTTAPVAGTVGSMPTTTTTATTTAPIASGTPMTRAGTVGGVVDPVAPTNVRATALSHGTVWVRWDPMPGALGYTIVRWLPDGKFAGANPLVRPEHAGTDTAGATMQLNNGPATLSVVARYEGNVWSPPSAKVSVDVPRWWGKYRISVLGFRVDRETRDDPMETDGKRDEVFVRAAVAERNADAQLVGNLIERQTFVYGDINHTDWQNASSPNYRLRAGSASALGGLMTGNEVPKAQPWQRGSETNYDNRLPLLLWEGDLHQGKHQVQVALSIWETDQRPGTNVATFGPNSPERAGIDAAAAAARRLEVEKTGAIIAAVAGGVIAAPAALPLLALSAPALAGTAAIAAVAYGASEAADASLIREITPRVPLVLNASSRLDQLNAAISNSPLVQNPVNAAINDADAAFTRVLDSAVAWAATTVNTAFGTAFLSAVEQLGLTLNVKDRPIGLRKQGTTLVSAPWILTFSFENIEGHALAGNGPHNLGPGVYAMQFQDDPLTFDNVHGGDGVYTLYVQVQRLY